ncbi:hypothetical protein PVAG01_00272 [Phlyctema vagabunda]|uniref:Uncharacterized protein n=1 Tax=Phlyctema vagabunda TaxID=108571 RepID=A0ABR4PTR4_9HELO
MTFLGFLRKCCIAVLVLVLLCVVLIVGVVVRAVVRELPWKKSISRNDKIWTSEVYTKHFLKREVYRHIKTFVYRGFVPSNQIRPEFAGDGKSLAAEVFRSYWAARNMPGKLSDQKNQDVMAAATGPVVGETGGSEVMRAEVVEKSDFELSFTISTAFNGYVGGLETIEVIMLEMGVIIDIKYIWHNPLAPRWWKFQWGGVYTALLGRTVYLKYAIASVSKIAPAEAIQANNSHGEL